MLLSIKILPLESPIDDQQEFVNEQETLKRYALQKNWPASLQYQNLLEIHHLGIQVILHIEVNDFSQF